MTERKIIWGGKRSADKAVSANTAHKMRWHGESSNEPSTGNTKIRLESKREIIDQNLELPINRYRSRFNNQNLELWRQCDEHQCGPCSIHNLCEALGNTVNLSALQMRQMRFPQSERQGQSLEDYHFHILDLESINPPTYN